MRVFVALDIDEVIRARIARFVDGVQGFAPEIRWVHPESLHVTLKFIGEQPVELVEQVKHALARIKADPFEITLKGYGFFPGAKSPRVFWIGMEAGPRLNRLAEIIDTEIFSLGIPKESHVFSPHLTLARSGSGSPRRKEGDGVNPRFRLLQQKLAALPVPEFGTMTATEFFLFQSQLSPGGSRYEKIVRFPL